MTLHRGLTSERWWSFSLWDQVLMIGSELKRLQHWNAVPDPEAAQQCTERAVELLELTIAGARSGPQRRELCRVRETLRATQQKEEKADSLSVLLRTLIGAK